MSGSICPENITVDGPDDEILEAVSFVGARRSTVTIT